MIARAETFPSHRSLTRTRIPTQKLLPPLNPERMASLLVGAALVDLQRMVSCPSERELNLHASRRWRPSAKPMVVLLHRCHPNPRQARRLLRSLLVQSHPHRQNQWTKQTRRNIIPSGRRIAPQWMSPCLQQSQVKCPSSAQRNMLNLRQSRSASLLNHRLRTILRNLLILQRIWRSLHTTMQFLYLTH